MFNVSSVFDGVDEFRIYVTGHCNIKKEFVFRFTEITERSRAFLPSTLHQKMQKVCRDSFQLLSLNADLQQAKQVDRHSVAHLVKRCDLVWHAVFDGCWSITNEMQAYFSSKS